MADHDELAHTATAPSTPPAPAVQTRTSLGRFRLDAILGQGGMGVVYAAFDPELERKIALKVLRDAGSEDARARLLREARAMAKLSHPNVISVFEVGSAEGQDFVAMELIDGETLADWLRRARPDLRAVVTAFVEAGQGLAAAHAAGIVHRDFKPSNVLRSRAGKIVVTDFGLARSSASEDGASVAGSANSGLEMERASERWRARPVTQTATGAILGTPAYMAPEQWTGGTITAATDQFGFCVALWEALAGERPYLGNTSDELRSAVLAGSAGALDKIPRSVRPILRRGLARDQASRWPSMAALLVALESTTRTRRAGLVIAAFAMVAAVAVIAAVRSQSPAAIECSAPAMDPDRVWSTPRAFMLATRDPELAKLAASDVAAWHAARSHACAMVPAERLPRLACLDAALARLDDALRAAVTESAAVDADELELELVDPVVCDRAPTPQLAPLTPELSSMFRFIRRARLNDSPVTGAEVESADRASSPCARALRALDRLAHGLLLFPIRDREVERARDLVAHCDDDKIRAAIAVRVADFNSDPARAAAAVARFPQADLRAELEAIGARHARQIMQWDLARTGYERAIELYGARSRARAQVGQIVELGRVLLQSGRPEDLARLGELAKQWLPIARGTDRSELEKLAQQLRWRQGDVAAADRELERLSAMADTAGIGTFTYDSFIGVTGEVVDEAGVPIANATVHSGEPLVGDAATAAMQLYTTGKRTAHTDGGGRFSLPFAHGAVVAQSGLLRSRPTAVASHVHLVLQPTTHAEGKVALGTAAASKLWVVAHGSDAVSANAVVVATVRPDGSFRLDGLPHGDLVIGAVEIGGCGVGDRPNHIKGDEREHILLAPSPPLYVIARSSDLAAPESAMIWAFTGYAVPPHPIYSSLMRRMPQRLDSTQFSAALPVDLAHVPTALAGTARADDLIGVFADRPEGDLVVCGLGFDKKQVGAANTFSQETGKAMLNEELACTTVAATQSVVILPLLPLRKFQAK